MGVSQVIMSFTAAILAVCLLSLSAAKPRLASNGDIEIRDCGSKVDIQRIEFDQCEDFPCVVHHGQTATGRATMVAQAATNSLTCKIVGIVAGIELPFNGCPVNACDNLSTGDCDVEVGETIVYEMEIPILSVYPPIEITGKWMLKDDAGENFLCFEVPMKLKPEYRI